MTTKEIELIKGMYAKYNHRCFNCGEPATQRAHIIGNTKANRKAYGSEIIDSPLNWLPACSLGCNALMDIGKGFASDRIAGLIKLKARTIICELVQLNITRKKSKHGN